MNPILMTHRIRSPGGAFFLALLFIIVFALEPIHGEEIRVGDYSLGLAALWKEKVFRGRTSYEVVQINGGHAIKAESRAEEGTTFIIQLPVTTKSHGGDDRGN